jgi:hypothetical protein
MFHFPGSCSTLAYEIISKVGVYKNLKINWGEFDKSVILVKTGIQSVESKAVIARLDVSGRGNLYVHPLDEVPSGFKSPRYFFVLFPFTAF